MKIKLEEQGYISRDWLHNEIQLLHQMKYDGRFQTLTQQASIDGKLEVLYKIITEQLHPLKTLAEKHELEILNFYRYIPGTDAPLLADTARNVFEKGYSQAESHYKAIIEERDKKIEDLTNIIFNPKIILDERLNHISELKQEISRAKELLEEALDYINIGSFESSKVLSGMTKRKIQEFLNKTT